MSVSGQDLYKIAKSAQCFVRNEKHFKTKYFILMTKRMGGTEDVEITKTYQ